MRKYEETTGQPDFELEKFAINSLLSATHTSEMQPEDQKSIIDKIKSAGQDNGQEGGEEAPAPDGGEEPAPAPDMDAASNGEEKPQDGLGEGMDNLFVEPKKNNMFQPNSNDVLKENLPNSGKISIFGKDYLRQKLSETFKQEDTMTTQTEPAVAPVTKPVTTPTITPEPATQPSRKNKPFLPSPNVQPDPKARK